MTPSPAFAHAAPAAAPRRPAFLADAETLQRLARTLQTLLAPLDYPDWQTWQVAVHGRLLELTGADALCVFTPLADGPAAWYSPHLPEDALATYGRRAAADPSWELVESRFGALGREVAHEADLFAPGEREASAMHREFLAPHAIHDLTVVGVEFGGRMAARLHFSHAAPRDDDWQARRDMLLRAVVPAFRAALSLWRQLGERRRELGRMVDALPQAVLLYEASGTLLHANPGARRLLEGGPDAERLRAAAQQVAWTVGAQARRAMVADAAAADRELRVGARTVRLHGAVAPAWMLGREPGVLVTLESVVARPLEDEELRARFGLTAREVEVARLLAGGLSNQDVADRLGVSFFTARNHVERLLPKLGASSRARVGALLRGEQ